jgi:signal recognition particle receptor subunit beta
MVKIDDTLHTQLHLLPIDGPYSTWKVLAEPAMGGIVLLACDQADTFAEVAREIKKINDYRPVQWVIATHTSADCSDDVLHAAIGLPETCPVIGVDPADKDSARAVLRQLLVLLADDE